MSPQRPNPASATPNVEETNFPVSQQGASATELILGCPCGQRLKVARSASGKQVRCPVCSRLLLVPVPSAGPATIEGDTLATQNKRRLDESPTQDKPANPSSTITSAHSPTAGTSPTPPQHFGDYEVLSEIARGGMGVVYKARQVSLNRIVALKMILSGQLSSRDAIERFQREARAAATLDHPNIVPVYEVGEIDGQHFFSMGFVAGGSLQGLVQKGPLPPKEAARLVRLTAEAVQHAHDHGVIHRDLKPHNVLLEDRDSGTGDRENRIPNPESRIPKLTDFGLARIAEEGGHSVTGDVMGTPSYMPPEQARGELKEIGPSADIYSLGAVLYCLLTGRPPFQAATAMDTMMLAISKEPLSPRELNPHVPRDLETVCLKCLEKQKGRRYPTARALAEELGRYERSEPVQARPVGRIERGWRWCLRNKAVAGLLLAVMLSLLTGAIVSLAFAVESRNSEAKAIEREGKEREAREAEEIATKKAKEEEGKAIAEKNKAVAEFNRAEEEKKKAQTNFERAEIELEKARANLFTGQLLRVNSYWQREPVLGLRLLQDEEVCPPSRRDPVWHLYHRLCDRQLWNQRGSSQFLDDIALSPDDRTVASTWALGVDLWEAGTGKRLHNLTLEGIDPRDAYKYVRCLAWHPDGKALLVGCGDGTIRVVDPVQGKETARLTGHQGRVFCLAVSPDGTTFASGAEDKTIKLWDAATRTVKQTLTGHTKEVSALAYHPGGKSLLSGSVDESFRFWDLGTGQSREVPGKGTSRALAFYPDGKSFLAAQFAMTRWDADGGKKIEELSDLYTVRKIAFSKDGKSLAVASLQGGLKVVDAASSKLLLTLHHGEESYAATISSDGGRAFATHMNHVSAWDVRRDRPPLTLLDPGGGAYLQAAFRADGRTLVTGGEDGNVRQWDLAAETAPPPLKVANSLLDAFDLGPDEKTIAFVSRNSRRTPVVQGLDGKQVGGFNALRGDVWQVRFSPDGKRLVTGLDNSSVIVWDAVSRRMLSERSFPDGLVHGVAFTPDSKTVAVLLFHKSFQKHRVELWDPDAGTSRVVAMLPADRMAAFVSMAISPDGKTLLTGTIRGGMSLWDLATGKELFTTAAHASRTGAVGFIGDGSMWYSHGLDGVLKFWDAATRQQRAALTTGRVLCASKDGKRIATAGAGKDIQVWDLTPLPKP